MVACPANRWPSGRIAALSIFLALANGGGALAQEGAPPTTPSQAQNNLPPNADVTPSDWSVHGQVTVVDQGHLGFRSPYSGPQSLNPGNRQDETISATAYIGRRLWDGGEIYFDPEFNQGDGFNHTTGLAGFPNGEAQKASSHVPKFNPARAYIKQVFGLGGEQEDITDDLNSIAGKEDVSRITVWAGKLAVNDLFDTNVYAHDPRNDFLNWSIWEGGAYDYAADPKGYSDGVAIELNQKRWAFRVGDFLLPRFSNSRDLDTRIFQHHGLQAEFEERHQLFGQDGKLRILGFANTGYMGSYAQALLTPTIDITQTRATRTMTGLVLNLEQGLTDQLGMFARFSLNDGRHEIMSFTDISRSGQLGFSLKGSAWGRPQDTVGLATAINALSGVQIAYFAAGGTGILIGDGKLNYATEDVLELYYRAQLTEWASLTGDYQFIANPAYNADRGPVSIFAARVHLQF